MNSDRHCDIPASDEIGLLESWPLVTAAEMRGLDRFTIDTLGISGEVLMESAGRAVVEVILERLSALAEGADAAEVCVVCGLGNNGGDGFVVARHLHLLGVRTRVVLAGDPMKLQGDAAANLARARAVGVRVEGEGWQAPRRGILVDAVFGTGLTRAVEGGPAQLVGRINGARGPSVVVIAVDIPSGLDSDTGQELGVAVRADETVTIGLPKRGLVLEPGRTLAGRIRVARIGIVDALPDAEGPSAVVWTPRGAGSQLPARPQAGHKGSFGHVLLVAGSEGKTGAAALAAQGAGRAGAGLVTIACPAGLNDILEIKCTEAMTVPVPDTTERSFAAAAEDAVMGLASERDVVAAGPGIGRHVETRWLMHAVAKRLEVPLVLDADGIVAFEGELSILKARQAPTILTPHPGEAARVLGCTAVDLNRDRIGAALELAEQAGSVVLLKGAATVAAEPGGRVIVNPTGGPALATGGTGDVLLGMVAAYVAQGLAPLEAAAAAAYVHGAAADGLAGRAGEAGLLASDVAAEIPMAAEALRCGLGAKAIDGMMSSDVTARRTDGDRIATSRLAVPFPGA